jgi:hypothetical protein
MHADEDQLREKLERLQAMLAKHGEPAWADRVGSVLSGPDDQLRAFLESNSLWGGSGSLADMAGVGQERVVRCEIEAALIDLGEAQRRAELVNLRTASWVEAFRKWRDSGI